MPNSEATKHLDRIGAMNTYIEGKMKRYNLLFAVNGGAFAIAKLIADCGQTTIRPTRVLGGLGLRGLAIGASIFTIVVCWDIWMFGRMMRKEYFDESVVFGVPGKLILCLLGSLLSAAWLLAAFG